ncbi:hypothetical protein CAEBREN_12691 [Caenorhabditis brenneri]|uniref:Uncharacterized protein n=1 Tax=Caenorhabditis brenneri TaxID=135651 RepID=G0MJQ9_CAEBE|nr:hypothetical protein CAEBREN_12691 [Caenorhabditis brenneri]
MASINKTVVTSTIADATREIDPELIPGIMLFLFFFLLVLFLLLMHDISGNPKVSEEKRNETNQPKIEVIPEENTELINQDSDENYQDWTIKYCSKRRRKVMTSMDSGEVVVHQEWIDSTKQMRIEKCEECTKEGLEKEEQPPAYSSIFVV